MKNKATLLNMISGLILQLFTLVSGFILPKIILIYFGSEVNGLVSSLNQFLSYITLVEGGITGVIVANLYKPIVDQDNQKISSVLITADRFYKRIGALFISYSIILSIIYPLYFKTEFKFAYVCSLTLILSITLLIQYMFSLTLKTLLNADKKGYIVNFTQTLIVIFNVIFALISVCVYPSIHVLKLISGSLFILQPIVFNGYVKKNYKIVKTTFDLTCLTTTVILSLAILHGFYGIGIGTIFCAFLTGKTVSAIQSFLGKHVEFYRATGKKRVALEKNMRHA